MSEQIFTLVIKGQQPDVLDLLKARAKDGKCVAGYFNHEGQFESWWPTGGLTLMEKLFIVDTLKRRIQEEHPI